MFVIASLFSSCFFIKEEGKISDRNGEGARPSLPLKEDEANSIFYSKKYENSEGFTLGA
jgi:hypothetical protein